MSDKQKELDFVPGKESKLLKPKLKGRGKRQGRVAALERAVVSLLRVRESLQQLLLEEWEQHIWSPEVDEEEEALEAFISTWQRE